MMSIQSKVLTVVLSVFLLALIAPTHAVVIGSWEGGPDGWIDWNSGQVSVDDPSVMPSEYNYDTVGATLGSQSLKLTTAGWGQTLSIKLQDNGFADDFLANDILSFDLTIAADTLGIGGWAQIENIVINSDIGWAPQLSSPTGTLNWWSGSPEQSVKVVLDYSAHKAAMIANGPINWIEIVFETNGYRTGDLPVDLYFDNVELTPAAIGIADWEGTPDGCVDWNSGLLSIDDPSLMPSKYSYNTDPNFVTLNSQSLHLVQDGWYQGLTFVLDEAQRAAFMANRYFSVDIMVPADTTGVNGYSEIQDVILNAEGYNYTGQLASPFSLAGGANQGMSSNTLVLDYNDAKPFMPASPAWVEILLITNNDENAVGARDEYYFDNATLSGGLSSEDLCAALVADITGDCIVNLYDFAELAATWMLCNDPAGCP